MTSNSNPHVLSPSQALHAHIKSLLHPPNASVLPPDTLDPLLQANALVQQARSILQRAEDDAHTLREDAKQRGYEDGLRQAAHALTHAHNAYNSLLQHAEHDIARLALNLCHKILGTAYNEHRDLLQASILNTLQLTQGSRTIQLHVHPNNLAMAQEAQTTFQNALPNTLLSITPDPRVPPHGCQLHTDSGVIESDLTLQLTLFADAMGVTWSPT